MHGTLTQPSPAIVGFRITPRQAAFLGVQLLCHDLTWKHIKACFIYQLLSPGTVCTHHGASAEGNIQVHAVKVAWSQAGCISDTQESSMHCCHQKHRHQACLHADRGGASSSQLLQLGWARAHILPCGRWQSSHLCTGDHAAQKLFLITRHSCDFAVGCVNTRAMRYLCAFFYHWFCTCHKPRDLNALQLAGLDDHSG